MALLGPNGAGKTTLVKLLLGVFAPQQGSVRMAGGDPRQHATRQAIGTMPQISGVPENLSVAELADLFASLYPDPLPRMAALLGLEDDIAVVATAGEGLSNRAIGQQLHLAEGTVRNYLSEAINELHAGNRIEAYRLARQQGWL